MNTIRQCIEEILQTSLKQANFDGGLGKGFAPELRQEATEAILQAVRDVVPSKQTYIKTNRLDESFLRDGWNNYRAALLKALGEE